MWLHTWNRPGTRLSAVAKISCLALVPSGDARRTLLAEKPSGAARINCCLGTVESSAVTIWNFLPVCCSVTIWKTERVWQCVGAPSTIKHVYVCACVWTCILWGVVTEGSVEMIWMRWGEELITELSDADGCPCNTHSTFIFIWGSKAVCFHTLTKCPTKQWKYKTYFEVSHYTFSNSNQYRPSHLPIVRQSLPLLRVHYITYN